MRKILLHNVSRFSIWLKKTSPGTWDSLKILVLFFQAGLKKNKLDGQTDPVITKQIVVDLKTAIRQRPKNASGN